MDVVVSLGRRRLQAREFHLSASGDVVLLTEARIYFKDKLRRTLGRDRRFREWRGVCCDTDDCMRSVNENDVERKRRVFHPKR